MKIIEVRNNPAYLEKAIQYIYSKWGNVNNYLCYHDCIEHSVTLSSDLPRWYLMENDDGEVIGCAGLLINDFISRMDLYPWISSIYLDENYRGQNLSQLLIDHIKGDAKKAGFKNLYIATKDVGYCEKHGFSYIGLGYLMTGETMTVYSLEL